MISKHWHRNHDVERVASTRELIILLLGAYEHLEDHMTEITDALNAEGNAITQLGTSLTNTLNDLQAEVSNLQSNPSIPDGALDALNQHVASLQSLAAQVAAADPGAQPAPVSSTTTDSGTPAPAPADSGTPAPAPTDSAPAEAPAPVDTTGAGSGNQVPDPNAATETPAPPAGTDTAPDASPTGA